MRVRKFKQKSITGQMLSSALSKFREELRSEMKECVSTQNRKSDIYEQNAEAKAYIEGADLAPSFGGWAIDSGLAIEIIHLLDDFNPKLVIEFGSGTSTVLISRWIENQKKAPEERTTFVAFEHIPDFSGRTNQLLTKYGLGDFARIEHCPLVHHQEIPHHSADFYDSVAILRNLADTHSRSSVFVLADGPPETTGLRARYPAVPLVHEHLVPHRLCIVLDDVHRPAELSTAQRWFEYLKHHYATVTGKRLDFTKGAMIIKASDPLSPPDSATGTS